MREAGAYHRSRLYRGSSNQPQGTPRNHWPGAPDRGERNSPDAGHAQLLDREAAGVQFAQGVGVAGQGSVSEPRLTALLYMLLARVPCCMMRSARPFVAAPTRVIEQPARTTEPRGADAGATSSTSSRIAPASSTRELNALRTARRAAGHQPLYVSCLH